MTLKCCLLFSVFSMHMFKRSAGSILVVYESE